ERLLAPRIPVDRLMRRPLQVRGGILREAIGTALPHPTDACARSLWPFGTRPRDHLRQHSVKPQLLQAKASTGQNTANAPARTWPTARGPSPARTLSKRSIPLLP